MKPVEDRLRSDGPAVKGRWIRPVATLVSLLVSGTLLATLYRSLDLTLVAHALLRVDRVWLVISVGMIVPITYLRAVRFYWVAPAGALPGTGEAFRLTLVASALNIILPAKAGDLVKGYFVATRSATPAGVALAIVVYERLCDLFALIAWCFVGLLVGRPQIAGIPDAFWLVLGCVGLVCLVLISSETAADVVRTVARRTLANRKFRKLHELADGWPGLIRLLRGRRRSVVSYSLALWMTHLIQIWLFTLALSAPVPFMASASLTAIALMAGQVPFTFAGLGVRDVVLVVLLASYMTPESAAAMGVLISTRNLLPPFMGLFVMRPYLSSVVDDARRWRQKMEMAS